MPAEIPEDDQMLPSTTHRACGTHLTLGPRATVLAQADLFVVARRPSSTPALAASPAPVQTVIRYLNLGYVVVI